ncbi:hypothetical protein JMX53_06685 [Cutibacterium avidum]|uniref:Uncharacterized protein n=1 Tax=Cutibacterium namnetense TaxID=1574624 RepID=A0ABX9I8P9_9ACTN|nr:MULTISPECIES: hypothetical protein [Cutibacterium]QQY14065.1 hypothetical protein JMX53_06685 [Cutibacterium avidum]REB69146.1 hypothetical protein CP880_06695 [Cutibacterium namnetense]
MSPVTSLVLNRVQLIAPRIDEAMASAIIQAETRAQGFEQDRFPHIRPLNIRQDVRLSLEAEPLPGGWRVEGDPRKMGQLLLVDSETGMTVRFLKAPYTQPDHVPHAGYNPARRETWSNEPLDTSLQTALPSLGDAGTLAKRTDGLHGETFLLIWAWKDPSDRESGYDLRIVHTRAPGAFGKATPCDLDLVIPRGGLVNEDGLRFVGSDEDSDLFIFDIPDENDTEGLAGQ